VEHIYLDPGTSKAFVNQSLVDKARWTKKVIDVKTINPGYELYISGSVCEYKTSWL